MTTKDELIQLLEDLKILKREEGELEKKIHSKETEVKKIFEELTNMGRNAPITNVVILSGNTVAMIEYFNSMTGNNKFEVKFEEGM